MPQTECPHVNQLQVAQIQSFLNPRNWACVECGTTDGVWACMLCSHVACGSQSGGHSQKHYDATKHCVVIEVNERRVYCYECQLEVKNDTCRGDIQLTKSLLQQIADQNYQESCTRSGKVMRPGGRPMFCRQESKFEEINSREADKRYTADCHHKSTLLAKIFTAWMLYVSVEKKERVQDVSSNADTDTASVTSNTASVTSNTASVTSNTDTIKSEGSVKSLAKRKPALTPGITGLRNLGNTCYMNAVLQALGHLAFFRESFRGLIQSSYSPVPQTPLPSESEAPPKLKRSRTFNRQTTIECFDHISTKVPIYGPQRTGVRGVGLSGGEGGDIFTTHSTMMDPSQESDVPLLCQELHALMRVMWSGKWAVVTPHAVLASIWRNIPSFHGYAQQDAQEFLCEILYRLQSELEHFPLNKPLPIPGSSCCHQTIPSQIIPNLFEGQLQSEVKYLTCGHTSITTETFWDLSIDFPERYQTSTVGYSSRRCGNKGVVESPCDLEELLSRFTSTEQLEGKVFKCDQCCHDDNDYDISGTQPAQLQYAEKKLLIRKTPDVLRLHLKRFRWVNYTKTQKINAHVNFDFELNLSDFRVAAPPTTPGNVTAIPTSLENSVTDGDNNQENMYDLVSVIMHHGTGFGSGHYSSYCWNNIADCWVHCNDARIKHCSVDEVAQSQAYILFYMRRHGITSDTSAHVIPPTPTTPFPNLTVPPCSKRRKIME